RSHRGGPGAAPGGRCRRARNSGGRLLRAAGARVPGAAGSAVPGAGRRRLPLYTAPGRLLRAGGLLRRLGAPGRRVLLLADEGDRSGPSAGLELFQPPGVGPAPGAVRVLQDGRDAGRSGATTRPRQASRAPRTGVATGESAPGVGVARRRTCSPASVNSHPPNGPLQNRSRRSPFGPVRCSVRARATMTTSGTAAIVATAASVAARVRGSSGRSNRATKSGRATAANAP